MSILAAVALGLAMGLVFGFALEKSRVFEPGVIIGQMRLETFIMLKVFFAAVATGLVVVAALTASGLSGLHPKPTLFAADLVGGLLLGAGIAVSGACPGTIPAQIGAGYRDAWLTLAGGLLGALAYALLDPLIAPALGAGGLGKVTIDQVVKLPFWMLALWLAAIMIVAVVALERWRPWRTELGPAGDGERERPAAPPRGRAVPAE
jgi:hypothetical protein